MSAATPGGSGRRVFLALPLPAAAGSALGRRCACLDAAGRWRAVPPDAYHVTVHFFGALPADALLRARQLTHHPELAAVAAIRCRLVRFGQFPARGRARVLYAELGEGREPVTALLALARTVVAAAGFAVERRPPQPHVTVARARRGEGRDAGGRQGRRDRPSGGTDRHLAARAGVHGRPSAGSAAVTAAAVTAAEGWAAEGSAAADDWRGDEVSLVLNRLVLFESHLSRAGARYQPLEVQPLAGLGSAGAEVH